MTLSVEEYVGDVGDFFYEDVFSYYSLRQMDALTGNRPAVTKMETFNYLPTVKGWSTKSRFRATALNTDVKIYVSGNFQGVFAPGYPRTIARMVYALEKIRLTYDHPEKPIDGLPNDDDVPLKRVYSLHQIRSHSGCIPELFEDELGPHVMYLCFAKEECGRDYLLDVYEKSRLFYYYDITSLVPINQTRLRPLIHPFGKVRNNFELTYNKKIKEKYHDVDTMDTE